MRKTLFLIAAAVAAVASGPNADAMLITHGSDVLNGALAVNSVTINDTVGSGGAGFASIAIDANVLKGHTLAQLNFNISSVVTEAINYKVTLTLHNLVTPFNTAAGWAMNGFDITSQNNGSFPLMGLGTPLTSDKFGFSANPAIPNGFRFGGKLGGGGEIYNGDTAVSTFIIGTTSLGAASSSFTLNFTANPEPTSLMLGGLAMVSGGLAFRRRRKAVQEVVESV